MEFLSTWEEIYNPNFKVFESEHFKKEAGLVTFTPSVSEWVEKTNAVGLYVKRGKYGGTFAHKDIAFEFASAISPVFKLYLIKEFQRLKEAENDLQKLEWDAKRFLVRVIYLILIFVLFCPRCVDVVTALILKYGPALKRKWNLSECKSFMV